MRNYSPLPLITVLLASAGAFATDELPPIRVPDGFEATVFHEGLGPVRHIAVRDNGDVYVARSFRFNHPGWGVKSGWGSLIALRDENGDGAADRVEPFGPTDVTTEVRIYKDWLYYSSDIAVYRIPLDDELVPARSAEPVAGGFPMQGSHGSKTLAFDESGQLYVNSGAPSNACQAEQRTPGSPGLDPCPQLERSGSIWRFDADATEQDQLRDGERFVTGIRNVVAMAWNPWADRLYFVMHGRDSLHGLFPDRYTEKQSAELPAEEFHVAAEGDDFGWPRTYFDPIRGQRMLAPEYGGDGEIVAEGDHPVPLIAFPAHWAPNDMFFHSGKGLPDRYAQGAFIVFHGSWNRSPFGQEGYKVVFVPMRDGRVTGDWEVFADGFKGADTIRSPAQAAYRPTGLAEGPDGAIYITEDKQGRIWKVRYAD